MRILCVRHVPFEGPGAIAGWAHKRGHTLTEAYARRGELPDIDAFEMLVVLGGPMGADDAEAHPYLDAEKRLISEAAEAGRLVLGVCLGAQLTAAALGGRVFRNPEREIGFFPVTLTTAGRREQVFKGWPETFMAGHWHGDTFEPPDGSAVAAVSQACMRQAFATRGGRVVGLQFHLEWTEDSIARLIDACGDDLAPGAHVQTADQLTGHPEVLTGARELLGVLLDRMEALL
jgi:GMP synthase-like glutamine amidotransferase